MKTIEEIIDFSRPAADIIGELSQTTIALKSWQELEKEYDVKKHPVFTDPTYVDKKRVKLSRIGLNWNKLAVKRMSELCFAVPVKRIYNAETEKENEAVKILEDIYRKNHINNVNIQRARLLYSSCQFATIWYAQLADTMYAGQRSRLKLRCRTYSPKNGETIYPLFDDYDDLIALSISYTRSVGSKQIHYFETYTAKKQIRWVMEDNTWEVEADRDITIGKIAGVFACRKEPVWEDESSNVYEAEWELSRNANYLRKNSKPNWVVCCNKEELYRRKREEENDEESRNILYYPADAKVGYETWNQSIETLKFQNEALRRNYFMQLQLPDMSFESMKSTPMSGEARKMMFIDAELKVTDESGEWQETFEREFSVIKEFAKLMFPAYASEFEKLTAEHVITAYKINDEMEKAQIATQLTGGKAVMSQRTAIKRYADVDDVDKEMEQINAESASSLEEIVL